MNENVTDDPMTQGDLFRLVRATFRDLPGVRVSLEDRAREQAYAVRASKGGLYREIRVRDETLRRAPGKARRMVHELREAWDRATAEV